jgi:hypothetical protein
MKIKAEAHKLATAPKSVRVFMFDLTQNAVNYLFNISMILLLIGSVLVVVGTYGSYRMGAIKERLADQRISSNEAEAERAKADAATANARAAEAQLALAKFRAGRTLSDAQKSKLRNVLSKTPKGPVIIKPNFLSPEPTRYANALSYIFNESGFVGVGDKPLNVVNTSLPGVFVVIRDANTRPKQFEGIASAFQAADIPFSAHYEAYVPDTETVVILIGEQP